MKLTKLLPFASIAFAGTMGIHIATACSCSRAIRLNNYVTDDPDFGELIITKESIEFSEDKIYSIEADLSVWKGDSLDSKYWVFMPIITAKMDGEEGRGSIPTRNCEVWIDSKKLNLVSDKAPQELAADEYVISTVPGKSLVCGAIGQLSKTSKIKFKTMVNMFETETPVEITKLEFGLAFDYPLDI